MGFTPGWVLGSTCGMITNKFVIGEISLRAYTNKFSKDLLKKYEDAIEKDATKKQARLEMAAGLCADMSIEDAIFNGLAKKGDK